MFKLSCMPTVDVAVVRELWPRWPEAGQKWTSTLMGEDDTVPQLVSTVDVDKTSPRLKDMTLGKVVDEALASAPEDLRWMTHAAQLPDFRSALRAKLLQQPSLLNPSARVPVLSLAFEGCDTVDLSCLEGLKQTDLLAVVQHLAPAAGTHRSMSLILPNMGDLTATALKEILGAAPITSLDLGETAIGLKSLLKIFSAAKVERFLCPALNKRAFDIKVINSKGPEGFGGICQPSTPSSIFLIGADTSFPLVQLVYVRQYRAASHPRLHSGELNWERMLQTLDLDVNLGGVRSGKVEEKAPKVLVMPLQDTLLSAKSIVEAALKLLRQLLQLPGGDIDPDGMSKGNKTLAMRLAMGMTVRCVVHACSMMIRPKTDGRQDDNKTQPIPAEALAAWKTHFCSSDAVAPQIQTGKTGSWTLIVFHECTSPKEANIFGPKQQPEVRYAFYRSLSTGGTQSTDGEGFLKATASEVRAEELVERWQDRMADLDDYAEPMDKERRGRVQKGKVVPASAAEVQGGLKLVKRYNEQVRRAAEKA